MEKVVSWIFVFSIFLFLFVKEQDWFSEVNAHALLEHYSTEQIDHFANFAFQDGKLLKWESDINYKIIDGEFHNSSTIHSIRSCVKLLDTLLKDIRITEDTINWNVTIRFLDSMEVSFLGNTFRKKSFFRLPYPTIKGGAINLLISGRDAEGIKSTVYHEFTHLLGFNHNLKLFQNSNWKYKSWFNGPTKTFNDSLGIMLEDFKTYPDLDKAAIRIMYDSDVAIDPGMTKDKFFRKIEEARKNIAK